MGAVIGFPRTGKDQGDPQEPAGGETRARRGIVGDAQDLANRAELLRVAIQGILWGEEEDSLTEDQVTSLFPLADEVVGRARTLVEVTAGMVLVPGPAAPGSSGQP